MSWSHSDNDTIPSTGKVNGTDTAVVSVPIRYLREANVKMIERNYYKTISEQQDSIIDVYKEREITYNKIIDENAIAVKKYKKQRNIFIIISGVLTALSVGLAIK